MLSIAEVFIFLIILVYNFFLTFYYHDELKEDIDALISQGNSQQLEHAKVLQLEDKMKVKILMHYMTSN